MNKKELLVGAQYKIKNSYTGSGHRLLSFGGYDRTREHAYSTEVDNRIDVKPFAARNTYHGTTTKAVNLMLNIKTEDADLIAAAADYTEADYLAGKEVPKGTRLVGVTSGDIEETWENHMILVAYRQKRRAQAEKLRDTRVNVTIPKLQAEFKRIGINRVVSEYDSNVSFTIEEFLRLSARVADAE